MTNIFKEIALEITEMKYSDIDQIAKYIELKVKIHTSSSAIDKAMDELDKLDTTRNRLHSERAEVRLLLKEGSLLPHVKGQLNKKSKAYHAEILAIDTRMKRLRCDIKNQRTILHVQREVSIHEEFKRIIRAKLGDDLYFSLIRQASDTVEQKIPLN
ncbi:hypothetical protein ACR78H_25070 [Sphingobacterium siyangense]|uniref:hypothetical protein n=1 Tax=Sphingobacterium siyangense TaxID=459529 RepID=UPI003DA67255